MIEGQCGRRNGTLRARPRSWLVRVACLLCAAVAGAAASPDPRIERQEWARDVDGTIHVFEVRNDHGDIRARFTADPRLEAFAVIQRLDPGRSGVGFTVERRGAVIALTTTYPPGRVQDADPDPPKASVDRLDLTVFVPRGVALEAHTLRGMVEARGLKSDIRAVTLAGPIFAATSGGVRLRTESGAIETYLSLSSGRGPLLLESESGAISASLPAQADLDLRVESAVPAVSDFKLAAPRESGVQEGRLGRGGRTLLVYSAGGRVEIRRLTE